MYVRGKSSPRFAGGLIKILVVEMEGTLSKEYIVTNLVFEGDQSEI